MKHLFSLILTLAAFLNLNAADLPKVSVSIFKSTFIYFDDQVVSIDLGMNESYDATFEKNFVRITAVKQMADYQTNLTVITKSAIYAFLVDYKDNPEKLYFFPEDFKPLRRFSEPEKIKSDLSSDSENPEKQENDMEIPVITNSNTDKSILEAYCKNVYDKKCDCPISALTKANVFFSVDQIYVAEDKFFIKIIADNQSNIDYDIDFVKFQIKNRRTLKRSSRQEVYKEPIFYFNQFSQVKANSTQQMVCVLDKFTILKDKQFFIEVEEKKGERNMSIEIKNADILNAIQIIL